MTVAIYLDVIVATLLVATITYAVILNRKLGRLRADRSGFEKMLKQFVVATERAESGVALLQRVADASASELDEKRSASVTLRDDLQFLVSRAEEQAEKLERLIADGRLRELPHTQTSTVASHRDETRDQPRKANTASGDPAAKYLFAAPDDEPEAFDDAFDETFEDEQIDKTPAWLASARKLAGADEVLR